MSSAFLIEKQLRLNTLRDLVINGHTKPEPWRRQQLSRIELLLETHENEIIQALIADLGKPKTEAMIEIIALRQELKLAHSKLKSWIKDRPIKVPLSLKPGEAFTRLEPLGCVLIIGPWNYPFSLTIQPLISAFAAGNTAVLKPSENAPHTSHLIATLFKKYFPKEIIQIFEGDGTVAAKLLEYPFDHIFFTGGEFIGRKILEAAAKYLTPVTLELGGKSPAIILEGTDLEITSKRLLWGKGLNAGQTCLAPNHLIVQETIKDSLLEQIKENFNKFYGPNPKQSEDIGRIVNDSHFNRLTRLIKQAKEKNQIVLGGEFDEERRLITPAIAEVNSPNDPLLEEEIFGPILPILTFTGFSEVLSQLSRESPPLAIYMFGGSNQQQKMLLKSTRSGGVCFNDVIMHAGIPEMPFGGVGNSGMGRYHGFSGFSTFSNERSILKRQFLLDFKFRYPPYKINLELLKKLLS